MVTYQQPSRAKPGLSRAVANGLQALRQRVCVHTWRPSRTHYGHSICKHCGRVSRI